VPIHAQGRVMAASRAVTMLTPPFGALAGGVVGAAAAGAAGAAVGYGCTIMVGAIFVLGSIAFLFDPRTTHGRTSALTARKLA
jgi:hypothetical protein